MEELEEARRQEEQLRRRGQILNPPQGATATELVISQTQRRGCSEILKSLSCDNLLGLKKIVIRGGLTAEDLIGIILNHSQTAEELLKRRKVLREDILKYLNKQGFGLSSLLDKQQLIDYALAYWSITEMNGEPSTAETNLQFLHLISMEGQEEQLRRRGQILNPPRGATATELVISQTQRRGCSEILKSLSCGNLLGLKDIVVRGGLTTEDLIGIILNHSQNAEELLKRRKVLHEDILKYLNKQGFELSPLLDKQQLIDYALTYWSITETNGEPSTAETNLQFLHLISMEGQEEQLRRRGQILNPPQGATATELVISQTQRRGCSEILKSLSCGNLLGLKDIVVRGGLTTEDLIGIILNHSQSAEELLKCRKVLHEDILKYLNKQGFELSPLSDKQQLIDYALAYWSITEMNGEPSTAETNLQFPHPIPKEELEEY
ncbi:uncharacterized protein [Hemitrygon akajei]|uniref:uncharacterized protein n=1 Tax=Hemitrygon akajei TaxID=2704970 RepID=UPI003BF9E5B2